MVSDRRTALKRARELFEKGDRRGASRALLDAGFSGSQIEAVFEGFLLEPAEGRGAPGPSPPRTAPPPSHPPPPPAGREGPRPPEPVRPGPGLMALFRRRPWVPASAAGAVLVLSALLLLAPPPPVGPPGGGSPTPSAEVPPAVDLALPGVASVALEECGWADWTEDGSADGVSASLRFHDSSGRQVAVGLPPGSLLASATVTERVDRPRFENVNNSLILNGTVTETRVLPVTDTSVVPTNGGWSLRVSGPAEARSRLSRLEEAAYTVEATVKTSVSAKFSGSCRF